LLETMTLVALGGTAIAIALYVVLETWLRAWEQRVPSPLSQVLYREGADAQRLASVAVSRELARAERSCLSCAAAAGCREWLESGSLHGYRNFCPNAGLVERLTADRTR
jgi:hypothetical protein